MMLSKRKLLRLKNYDYSSSGMYFVTVCVRRRKTLFGEIVVGDGPCAVPRMVLNETGCMVQTIWMQIPKYYAGVELDEFVVMPDHFHGIIWLKSNFGRARGPAPTFALPDVIHRFKSLTTTKYRKEIWPIFNLTLSTKLWQRGYYDRVIRNEEELLEIRKYICGNPLNWELESKV